MKDMFINKSFDFINKHQELNHYNEIKIRYGLEVMYYFVTKNFLILITAYFFHLLKVVLIFNLFYIPLRSLAHGFHAKNNLQCWIVTIISYILIIFYIKYIDLNFPSLIILSLLSVLSFILWSPADTKNLPLIRKNNRNKLKILSIITLCIEIIIMFYTKLNIITIAIIIESININPTIYRIFKLKFNNYIDYQ